jgi:hypothetical protein
MRAHLLTAARVWVVFDATIGFLFGQLFVGQLDLAGLVAGVFGLLAGVLSAKRFQNSVHLNRLVLVSCAAAIGGVAADAYSYYTTLNVQGNDYPWFLSGIFVFCLCVIAFSRFSGETANPSFKRDALKRAP